MAIVPEKVTVYTRGRTYKSGEECPDKLLKIKKSNENKSSFSEKKKDKDEGSLL